ncbi:hypothetical protein [Streptacidiphilus melanogenes]|uniref:hypothetical protein n=1 Tax=Streptacidiphilus melanogenes TaxID=411235 RepID=UPI00069476A2|nr:hypothetical protein [Streptacidiphilus melanogenes]
MGSSYAGTALPDSDIDLYAPMPPHCAALDDLRALLERKAAYEKTRLGPTGKPRHLFTFPQGTIKVDLNFVEREDHQLALTVVREIAATLDWSDRVAHTWIKHLLNERGEEEAYDQWKTTMRLRTSPTLRALMASGEASRIPSPNGSPEKPDPLPACCSAA